MNDVTDNRTLVLGATGKTGSRVAQNLLNQGIAIRTAARSGADVRFDWNDPSTFASALLKVSRVYLVSPVMRVDFADIVAKFLDEAERAGVRHVTYLSAYGMEHTPAEVALRAVELDLASRPLLSHSIVRPAWFMQNFSGHAGRAYSPTGPEALTFEDVAAHISNAVGRKISYCDIDRNTWIDAMIQAGVPAEYGEVLRLLTETIASGRGSRPNNDVLTVTGKAPISFAEFAAKTAAAWRQ
ncbi:NAD(P)H-binding protein [Dickeya chrysanthemi]|uniref:NAD(P)H-binding protein n=1 Tax=Dickeya chrysanthemi TaxID=556 RepID=UPI0025A0897A|nr:NAD(P)H-binding protein [Dickeya chrysanthemi]WJM85828.1 NAD(P)H-binding protein [Dickeya chrysanthemi]